MKAGTPEAFAAFHAALTETRGVVKSKTADTGSYKYDYATLEQALDSVKAACSKHGLVVTQEPTREDDLFALRTTLLHDGGGTVEFEPLVMPMPRDAQALGSASTYARRYSLVAQFGIPVYDDDGGEATRQARNQQQYGGCRTAQELAIREMLAVFGPVDRKALIAAFKDQFRVGLVDLPEHRHGEALDWLVAHNQSLLAKISAAESGDREAPAGDDGSARDDSAAEPSPPAAPDKPPSRRAPRSRNTPAATEAVKDALEDSGMISQEETA